MLAWLAAAPGRAASPPRLMLWAWERPEDLRFLRPGEAGVAFLAGTLDLRGDATSLRPRLQPLRVNPGTPLIAVVRIETRAATLNDARAHEIAVEIARLAVREELLGLQVDFDAARSQRAFYVALLRELRPLLRAGMRLEITSLASWCLFDDWLCDLPAGLVDGVVPMAFRMGADDRRVREGLERGEPLRCKACRESLGIATDEPPVRVPPGARIYAFNRRAWTREDVDALKVTP